MVLIRRDEGYWRKYVTVARAGLIIGTALVVCAAGSNPPTPGVGIENQPPKPPHEAHATEAKQAQQGTKENPFFVQVISATQSDLKPPEASDQNDSKSASNWWLVWFTGGLIIVGLVQARVFWVQAGKLQETIHKMDEIAARQLRAYVHVANGVSIEDVEGGFTPRAQVPIRNFGQTPAYKLMSWGTLEYSSFPLTGDLHGPSVEEIARWETDRITPKIPLGPGSEITVRSSLNAPLTDGQMSSLISGTAAIFAYGQIIYWDAFGKRRTTNFRLLIGGNVGIHGTGMAGAGDGNDAT